MSVEEAAMAGVQSMQKLISLLSQEMKQETMEMRPETRVAAVTAMSKFRKVVSLLGSKRTGHARFRRAPLAVRSRGSSTFVYAPQPLQWLPPLPPMAAKCEANGVAKCEGGGKCVKNRKVKVRKMVRMPVGGGRSADVPPDEFSWRKYGQKPIKGSPYPRGYYKCSTVRGCTARKHVERAVIDPTMLIVTYVGDHSHRLTTAGSPAAAAAAASSFHLVPFVPS